MKQIIITKCPICSNDLTVTKLHCEHCNIEIAGDFTYNSLLKLTKEQLTFVMVFLRNQGSIKGVEKDLNISYPTVKKILTEILNVLGLEKPEVSNLEEDMLFQEKANMRKEILDKLARKEISFMECKELLKQLGGK